MEQEKSKYRDATHDSLPGRLKAGEQHAAEELVDAYHEQLYMFMRRLGHGREVSEDLVQEIFLQAWRHIHQLRSETGLNGWLYRIAANVSRQWWRRNKRKLKAASIEDCEPLEFQKSGDENRGPEQSEQLRRLHGRVAGLSRKLREAVVLHYMQHLTISEAADAAGVRQGTFKSRLGRALQRFGSRWVEDENEIMRHEEREKLPDLLSELAESTSESVGAGLAGRIKQRIPQEFGHHRAGMNTVNIIIDFRINKLAAAAAIIITMMLGAGLFGGQDSAGQLYQDSKLLVKYCLGRDSGHRETVRLKYEYLLDHGKDVAYYGDKINMKDSGAVLMHWKLSDGDFRVIFADLHEKTVSAGELIKLQSRMIEREF